MSAIVDSSAGGPPEEPAPLEPEDEGPGPPEVLDPSEEGGEVVGAVTSAGMVPTTDSVASPEPSPPRIEPDDPGPELEVEVSRLASRPPPALELPLPPRWSEWSSVDVG